MLSSRLAQQVASPENRRPGQSHSTPIPLGFRTWPPTRAASDSSSTSAIAWQPFCELAPDKVDLDRPLLNLGLDSLTAMELKVEIDAFLGAALPLSVLLESGGIRELAERRECAPCRHSGQTARDGRRA